MKRSKRTWTAALVVLLVAAGVAEARGRGRAVKNRHTPPRPNRTSVWVDLDRLGNRPDAAHRANRWDSPGDDTIRPDRRARGRLAGLRGGTKPVAIVDEFFIWRSEIAVDVLMPMMQVDGANIILATTLRDRDGGGKC